MYFRVTANSQGTSPRGVESIVLYKLLQFLNGASLPCLNSVDAHSSSKILIWEASI